MGTRYIKADIVVFMLTTLLSTTASAGSLVDDLYDDYGVEINGFADLRGGSRLQADPNEKQTSLGETRFRLDANTYFDETLFTFKGELLVDGVTEDVEVALRELSLLASPLDNMDIKVGRSVFTWGTGDMLFINDTFAKDWQSFFIGRNEQYLKYPSNALKMSLFFDTVNMDIIYSPLFEGSRFVSGERLSYFNPAAGRIVGRNMEMDPEEPDTLFSDGELHGRLSKNMGGVEIALYGYSGFWQEPEGYLPEQQTGFYPRLNVWGGSIRSALLGGVGNIEAGYYDSIDNPDSDNPFVRPGEIRLLVGFERELAHELTGGFQYYVESIRHYDNYRQALPAEAHARDKNTGTLTLRLTKLLLEQNLNLSLFIYYSPDGNDGYARPKFSYKLTDQWLIDGGFNLFWGADEYTFWGQFQDNSNIYAGLRYSF